MDPSTTSAPVIKRKRRRPAVVCSECRRRKIACDRSRPCAQCVLAKTECVFHAPSLAANSSTARGKTALASLDRSLPSVTSSRPPVCDLPASRQDPTANASSVDSVRGSETSSETVHPSFWTIGQRLKDPLKGRVHKTRLHGQSHWELGVSQFEEICRLDHQFLFDDTSDLYQQLDECKELARGLKTYHRPSSRVARQGLRRHIPSRDVADHLCNLYLRTFENIFRILHVPSFLEQYSQFWTSPESVSDFFVVKTLLILSIGTCFSDENTQTDMTMHMKASQWIYAAQSWLNEVLDKHRLGIPAVQAQCLLLIALQTNAVGGDLTWIAAGTLTRTAMAIGLHRDPAYFPNMSVFHAEMRRRLWATTLEISLQSSLSAGMPALISKDDYDCGPPVSINDEDFSPDSLALPNPRPSEQYTRSSVQCLLLESFEYRLQVVKELNDLKADLTFENAVRLGNELTKICRRNSGLALHFNEGQDQSTAFAIKLLDLLTRRFILSLHAPFARIAEENVALYFSRKTCVESSLIILSYRPQNADGSFATDYEDDYLRLQKHGRGMFRHTYIHTYAMVCCELISELKQDSSPGVHSLARNELHNAVKEIVDISWCRVRAGETSVKTYVCFYCALAQIDAMRAGRSVAEAIQKAAKQSLDQCQQVLLERKRDQDAMSTASKSPNTGTQDASIGTSPSELFDLSGPIGIGQDPIDDWMFSNWSADVWN